MNVATERHAGELADRPPGEEGGAPPVQDEAGPPSEEQAPPAGDGGAPRLVAIGQAAAQAGVSERTLRYYEELGLVRPAAHSPGGSRRYGSEQVERVLRIRELQELLGLNLEEIKALLDHEDRRSELRAAWEADDDPEHRRAILEEAIESNTALRALLLAKRARMDAMIADIDERLARYQELLAGAPRPGASRPRERTLHR